MKQKNYFIIFFILGIFWAGCNNNTLKNSNFQKIDYSKTKKKYFDNIYIVNLDTCLKYELPKTSFAIEYPSHYNLISLQKSIIKYFHIESYEGNFYKSIIFATSTKKYKNKYEIIQALNFLDSFYNENIHNPYEKISIEERKIGKNIYYILTSKAIMYSNIFKSKEYDGYYVVFTIISQSKYDNITNILITITRKLNPNDSPTLNEEEIKILKSFRYVY